MRNHRYRLVLSLIVLVPLWISFSFTKEQYAVAQDTLVDTGYVSPTAFTDDDGFWQNEVGAFTDDNTGAYSTFQNNKVGRWHTYTLNIPANATIEGIEVRVDGSSAFGTGWYEIEVFNGTVFSPAPNGGTKRIPTVGGLATTKQTYIAGSPTDLWGLSWTPEGANVIQVRVRVVNLNDEHRLWWLPVKIYYSLPEPTETPTDTATPTFTPTATETPTNTPTPTSSPIPVPTNRKVVVFLEGITSDLTQPELAALNDDCSDDSHDLIFGKIKVGLLSKNFACSDFLRYSYNGGTVNSQGIWQPRPYSCVNTGQSLSISVNRLHALLSAYYAANPNTQFVLIGHSLGGVIAFETSRLVGSANLPIGSVAAVITIDSPLNHLSRRNLLNAQLLTPPNLLALCQARTLFFSQATRQLGTVSPSNRQTIRNENNNVVLAGNANGVRFMTIGNEQDCLFNLPICGLRNIGVLGGWINDIDTMIIQAANMQKLYPLGTQGCDLSTSFNIPCLGDPHSAALNNQGVIGDIAGFISNNP